MSTSEPSYHHGALRAALVDAGMAALEGERGLELSLRELARTVGVSPAAVYRHFPNKDALFGALADQGLALLGDEQRRAYESAGGGLAGFVETGRAYVRFGLSHPALFRLIFAHGHPARSGGGKSDPASQLLHDTTVALTGGEGPAAESLALRAWSLAHGIAMLMLDGRLPAEDALIECLIGTDTLFPSADTSPCVGSDL